MSELDILNFVIVTASDGGHHTFNWWFVIKHALNLIILIGILVYFARIPIKKALEKRKSNLSREIDEAKVEIDKAKEQFDEYSEKLNSLQSEISSLRESIENLGENEKNDIMANAQQTCELIKKDSKETIELEAFRAKQEIQQEVVNSSVKIAEKLIRDKMGDTHRSKTIDKLIEQIEEGKWLQ
ncbi:MAG: hypothetical protein ACR2NW_09510 [Thermodesulfobacteriota bacterium]